MSQQIAVESSALPQIASILSQSPQTITSPVYYSVANLIPFDQPVAVASTFVGMLYQLIMGFFVVVCGRPSLILLIELTLPSDDFLGCP